MAPTRRARTFLLVLVRLIECPLHAIIEAHIDVPYTVAVCVDAPASTRPPTLRNTQTHPTHHPRAGPWNIRFPKRLPSHTPATTHLEALTGPD